MYLRHVSRRVWMSASSNSCSVYLSHTAQTMILAWLWPCQSVYSQLSYHVSGRLGSVRGLGKRATLKWI
jgi:hypothetical protein